ncbi:translation initiation factor IF-2-like [Vidua macroura]|uniref:translation initiation factor IF-2-like n=1 Tax=Vidua macroura TaxID=187451 RepID=UPI0023A79C38|nr:translation initiation factor IF-2-like [Vidua macroura]
MCDFGQMRASLQDSTPGSLSLQTRLFPPRDSAAPIPAATCRSERAAPAAVTAGGGGGGPPARPTSPRRGRRRAVSEPLLAGAVRGRGRRAGARRRYWLEQRGGRGEGPRRAAWAGPGQSEKLAAAAAATGAQRLTCSSDITVRPPRFPGSAPRSLDALLPPRPASGARCVRRERRWRERVGMWVRIVGGKVVQEPCIWDCAG